jgi:hypothetical protein
MWSLLKKIPSTLVLSALMYGCGGASSVDGPAMLTVSLNYPLPNGSSWEKSTISASVTGLQGQQLVCGWGTSGAPEGFSINPTTCDIGIDGALGGNNQLSIVYGAKGYSTVSKMVNIKIDGPQLSYKAFDSNLLSDKIQWLVPVSADAGKPVLSNYNASPGDTVTFKTSGSFPPGISVDSQGQIVGTSTNSGGFYESRIWAEIKRGDRILTVKPFSLGRIQIASPFISYADMSIKVSDTTARATPTVTGLLPTDSYSFEKYSGIWYGCPQTSTAPPTYGQDGYVDAVSGAARPIAITAGSYCIPVAIVVTRNGQTAKFPNQLMAKIQ